MTEQDWVEESPGVWTPLEPVDVSEAMSMLADRLDESGNKDTADDVRRSLLVIETGFRGPKRDCDGADEKTVEAGRKTA